MVEIINKSNTEEELSKKQSKLEEITVKLANGSKVYSTLYAISIDDIAILVIPQICGIYVNDPNKLNLALDLAHAYEKLLSNEFFIKKEYSE